jgi:hypothetical protein
MIPNTTERFLTKISRSNKAENHGSVIQKRDTNPHEIEGSSDETILDTGSKRVTSHRVPVDQNRLGRTIYDASCGFYDLVQDHHALALRE